MTKISRRTFLHLSVVSPFLYPFPALAAQRNGNKMNTIYPRTIAVLQEAFMTEMTAYKRYIACTSKAMTEKYPNIAYLFCSLSHSEKIHADNYSHVQAALCSRSRYNGENPLSLKHALDALSFRSASIAFG